MKFSGVTILQGVKFSIFLLIFEWALQQCSATALRVTAHNLRNIKGKITLIEMPKWMQTYPLGLLLQFQRPANNITTEEQLPQNVALVEDTWQSNLRTWCDGKIEVYNTHPYIQSSHSLCAAISQSQVSWSLTSPFSTNIRDKRSRVESHLYPVKEGQRYINLNPGRLFVQQPPQRERDREANLNYYASAYNRQRQLSHHKTELNQIQQNIRINLN